MLYMKLAVSSWIFLCQLLAVKKDLNRWYSDYHIISLLTVPV